MIFVCNYTAYNISQGNNDSQICAIPKYISKYKLNIHWQSPSNMPLFMAYFLSLIFSNIPSQEIDFSILQTLIYIYLTPTNVSCLSKHGQFQCQPDRFWFPMIRLFYLSTRLEKAMVIWFEFNAML